eukprot:CAMPEP_0117445102 /NCGR_PEP_ID=MMETSP0759-20121206/5610_1 /TAXON_ID=63605 /ORGANISM="Percolomonas cosmopolitus, Strain WS" /LENGTH=679 /DNA_ID=CAMNT_0005237243 /DNA_START=1566 /DNA_END=3602 /DNA_ORIENTATION=-
MNPSTHPSSSSSSSSHLFPSLPPSHQSPYSILHNILYLYKHTIQNPTQRVRRPVRDSFEKDMMRFIVREIIIQLEVHFHSESGENTRGNGHQMEDEGDNASRRAKEEKEEKFTSTSLSTVSAADAPLNKDAEEQSFDSKKDAEDNDNPVLLPSSLNSFIRDLRDIDKVNDEDAICEKTCEALFAYYDASAHGAGANKKSSDDNVPAQPRVISLTERPYISQHTMQTFMDPDIYTYTREDILQQLHSAYQHVMTEYMQYTTTVYVKNIGERPSQNLTVHGEKHNTHYKVKKYSITVIEDSTKFWNIDANIKTKDGDTVLGKELQFRHIRNDGHVSHLKLLNGVKYIYSKQLPNMPTHYIARLVFDRTHRTMLAIKDGAVVGGITYKPFEPQGFAEIAFVAVDGSLQVKQCGTRLMNQLKHYFKQEGKVWRFLTFADNSAVGFFKKMGFSKDITIQNWRYGSYIKYYTDVSLMECVLRPGIPYLKAKDWVAKQEELVTEHAKIQEQRRQEDPDNFTVQAKPSRSHHGLYFNSKGNLYNKYKGSRIKRIEDVPGLKNARGLLPVPSEEELTKLSDELKVVWRAVHDHKDAHIFHFAVDRTIEDYYQIIKTPVDLSLIESRLDKLYYRQPEMFVADFKRLFDNCRVYNEQNNFLYNMANNCDRLFREKMKEKGFLMDGLEPIP